MSHIAAIVAAEEEKVSYDIYLKDIDGHTIELDEPHQMRGGTYALGGTSRAELNVTYNYAPHFYKTMEKGIRGLYGLTGAEAIPILEKAIASLGDDVDPDYWKPTEGNAKRALKNLLALARMRPDGIFDGD